MGDALKDAMGRDGMTQWETTRERDERQTLEKLERARLVGVVEALGRSKDGANFLRWLLDRSGVFDAPQFAGVEYLNFRNGMRAVGATLFDLCREAGIAGAVCVSEMEEKRG